jgi:hypothetical protein
MGTVWVHYSLVYLEQKPQNLIVIPIDIGGQRLYGPLFIKGIKALWPYSVVTQLLGNHIFFIETNFVIKTA